MLFSNQNKQNETRLDPEMEHDIYDLAYNSTAMTTARNAFVSMVLDCPPEIRLKSYRKQLMQSDFLVDVMRDYYLPFIHNIYDWVKLFGIYPWKPKRIKNTDMFYPWIPPFHSGYIATYINRSGEQMFRWYKSANNQLNNLGKSNVQNYDRAMKFSYKDDRSKPGLDGRFHSDVASMLREYKTEKIVRESTEIGAYHSVRPQHVIEHHPSKLDGTDDSLVTLESWGEQITGEVQMMQERQRQKKMQVRTDALQQSITYSIARNNGYTNLFGKGTSLYSEDHRQAARREYAGSLENAVPLQADYVYKTAAAPKVSVDLNKISKRLDDAIASGMDFPLQMIQGNSGKANFRGQSEYVNRRVQDWIDFFRREIKRVFLILHQKQLNQGMNAVNDARINRGVSDRMFAEDEVEVFIPCKTIASYDELRMMRDDGLISHENFAKNVGAIMSIPEEQLITNEPTPKKRKKEKEKEEDIIV